MSTLATTTGAASDLLEILVATDDALHGDAIRTAAETLGLGVRIHEQRTNGIAPQLVLAPLDPPAIARQATAAPTATIVALGADPGSDARVAAFRAGAAEVLTLPLAADELARVLEKAAALRRLQQPSIDAGGRVIAVVAPKEGVGATTLVANLGVTLADARPRQVALVDLDLRNGDLSLLLNVDPPQSLAELALGVESLDAVFVHGSLVQHDRGLSLLAASTERNRGATELQAAHVTRVLALLRATHRTVLVDAPPPLAGPALAAALHADRVLVPTEPTVPCLRAAWRTIEALIHHGVPAHTLDVIVTRHDPDDGSLALDAISDALGRPARHVIPREDDTARLALNEGLPIVDIRSEGPLQHAVATLATTLVPSDQPQPTLPIMAASGTL